MAEDYYWDVANATEMVKHLTRKELQFITSVLSSKDISMNNFTYCLWKLAVQQSDISILSKCCSYRHRYHPSEKLTCRRKSWSSKETPTLCHLRMPLLIV